MPADLSAFREEYSGTGLHRHDLAPDPFEQFESWFRQAEAAGLPEPNAMVLATAGADHAPTCRLVLLKAFDQRGFVFFSNYESTKARHLAQNPRAALNFPWHPLQRQVNVTGSVRKISRTESVKYFLSRPRNNQLGAWISNQSSVISSRKILEMKFDEMKRKFAQGRVPLPDHWGGYLLVPDAIEFWQGRESRLHDRFRYRRPDPDARWIIERLAP